MARVLAGANDAEKLADLSSKVYKEQAVWFLNAFWESVQGDAEKIWNYKHKFDELDQEKKANGNSLDELNAHRFLEAFHEPLTVHALRDKLRSTGAIGDRIRSVSLAHFLIFKYNVDWHKLVNAPQGSKEEIDKAQRMLEQVQAAFAEADARDREAEQALRNAHQREEELKQAKIELEAAVAELRAQEDAFNRRTQELQQASEAGGVVSRNKAKNELAQHLSSDPLPLRRAKITQEAALNKTEKATKVAEEARLRATEAKEAAEAALEQARQRVQEAEEYLEEAKKSLPHGSTWWLERELHEAKAYLPASKGGYKKQK